MTIDMHPAKISPGLDFGTVQVGRYKEATVLQSPNNKNWVVIVGDLQTELGLRNGTRYSWSGELYLDFGMLDGLPESFIGTCRPSKKLF